MRLSTIPGLSFQRSGAERNSPIPPCGHIAGTFARVDRTLGVHHPPVGESLAGVTGLAVSLEWEEENALDRIGVNTIRAFPGGRFTVLGSGTLDPGGIRSIRVRRLLIYLEQSICRGIGWAVREPETPKAVEGLQVSIREFLSRAWDEGMLVGRTESEAYFVRDGREEDGAGRRTGPLSLEVGVAPEKPGEFVIFTLTRGSSRFTTKENGIRRFDGMKSPDEK